MQISKEKLTVENIKEFIDGNRLSREDIKEIIRNEREIKDKILLKLLRNYVDGKKMKKYDFITGIPHCAYFNIYNKHITLISDFHYREDMNDIDSENQISVTNFFKEYLSTNINVIDFFIETSPYMLDRLVVVEDEKTQLSEEQDYTNSEMLRFVGEFKDCFQKKNCSGRFHYIDRRDEYKISFDGNEDLLDEKYNKAYDEYISDIRNFLITKGIVKNMFIFNLIIKHYFSLLEYLNKNRNTTKLEEISKRILFLYSMFEGDLEFYFKYDVPKIIKLDKQLYYINNDEIRNDIRKMYIDTIEKHKLYKLVEKQSEQLQKIDWDEVSIDFIDNLFGDILEPFGIINDIYTVSRIFRTFKDGTSVRNAVVFAGKAHIDNITRILNKFCENQKHYHISVGSPEYKIPIDIFRSLYNLTNN